MANLAKGDLPRGILPRPDPGYLQWLEKQSMLGASASHAAQVSGSGRLWQNSSQQKLATMQDAAPNWLIVNPHAISGRSVFRQLVALDLPSILAACGMNGLYLAPSGELGQIWTSDGSDKASPGPALGQENFLAQNQPDTAAVTSLFPDSHLGTDKDLALLAQALDKAQLQAGGDLLPAATGIGPDFMLQARHASRFDGIYAMLPVPREHWDKLPNHGGGTDASPWPGKALTDAQATGLAELGILPGKLLRDRLGHASRGGWAATGLVQGADGQPRRLVYRYSLDPNRPVLLWQDPSGRARQIFSAAIIRHTGLQGQSLAGLRLEAIMGLDPAPDAQEGEGGTAQPGLSGNDGDLAPGLEAIDSNAREIHRYGGWAMQADSLPPAVTQKILGSAVDFSVDTWTQPAVDQALLSGRTDRLHRMLLTSLPLVSRPDKPGKAGKSGGMNMTGQGVEDHSRLARMPAPTSVAGSQSLVALARQALAANGGKTSDEELARTCLLLLALRLGQPGLAFVDLGELVGQVDGKSQFSLSGSGQNQAFGLPTPGRKENRAEGKSFFASLGQILQARQKHGLSRGRPLSVQYGQGWLALASRLPDGSCWLVACNFSGKGQNPKIRLPETGAFVATHDLNRDSGSGRALAIKTEGQYLEIELARLSARHILLQAGTKRRQP